MDPTYDEVMAWFHGKCVWCYAPAVTCHEITPRSKLPRTWWYWTNRVPLCAACHEQVTVKGWRNYVDTLKGMQRRALEMYHTLEKINEFYAQLHMSIVYNRE